VPFAADPSQQLARLDGAQVRELVDGARFLFTNEYETALLLEKTGWDQAEVLRHVGTWITTHGEAGVRIRGEGRPSLAVPAVPVAGVVDPTGVGDAFRAGFLAGTLWGVPERCAAQLGCAVAATVLDYVGTQEYRLHRDVLLDRIRTTYGVGCTAELLNHLRGLT
ncbi:PfkB family carbohydrate kinase, partial [Streptomyces roseicoloratus]